MRALIGLFAAALLMGAGGCSKHDDASAPADQQAAPASPTTPSDTAPPATPESTPTPSESPPPADSTTPSNPPSNP
ncbi:MAG: hypothetical protein ACJ8OJ_14890 [Povalibacter sp.]